MRRNDQRRNGRRLPPSSVTRAIEDHVESPGQGELYLVLSGRAKFVLGDDEIDAPVGTVIFVAEPDLRGRGDALEDNTVVMAVGGWSDQPYHSLPWEPIYLAQEAINPSLRDRASEDEHLASLRGLPGWSAAIA